jgi:WD40 repeat protein
VILRRILLTIDKGPIFAVRFSRDGRWLLTASLDATACVWDMQTKKLHTQYRVHTGADTKQFSCELTVLKFYTQIAAWTLTG